MNGTSATDTTSPRLILSACKSNSHRYFDGCRPDGDKSAAEFKHWNLNADDNVSKYPLDYRISSGLQQNCSKVNDVKQYLENAYMGSVGVEFEHVQNEDERLWLYENYEAAMLEPVSDGERIKALQLLLRTECMEQFM